MNQYITVGELIEKLSVIDQELEVVIGNEGETRFWIDAIKVIAVTKDLNNDRLVVTIVGDKPYEEGNDS